MTFKWFRLHLLWIFIVGTAVTIQVPHACAEDTPFDRLRRIGGEITGEDKAVETVYVIDLSKNRNLTDDDLRVLCEFPQIRALWISSDRITDGGIKRLSILKQFGHLELTSNSISDSAFSEFPKSQFDMLSIASNSVNTAMCKTLAKFDQLASLSLISDSIRDDDVALFIECKELQGVSLRGNKLTDECTKHILKMDNLTGVTLGGENISDKTVDRLRACKNLTHLGIDRTKLTRASVRSLADYPSFKNSS
ncbi:MAG: hypothetical protein ACJ8C4_10070 [Gemmataceae bacterium]